MFLFYFVRFGFVPFERKFQNIRGYLQFSVPEVDAYYLKIWGEFFPEQAQLNGDVLVAEKIRERSGIKEIIAEIPERNMREFDNILMLTNRPGVIASLFNIKIRNYVGAVGERDYLLSSNSKLFSKKSEAVKYVLPFLVIFMIFIYMYSAILKYLSGASQHLLDDLCVPFLLSLVPYYSFIGLLYLICLLFNLRLVLSVSSFLLITIAGIGIPQLLMLVSAQRVQSLETVRGFLKPAIISLNAWVKQQTLANKLISLSLLLMLVATIPLLMKDDFFAGIIVNVGFLCLIIGVVINFIKNRGSFEKE